MPPEDFMKYLISRFDRLDEVQGEMQADLKYHIKRTDLLEGEIGRVSKALVPLETHVAAWGGVGKALTILGLLGGLGLGVWRLFL